MASTTNMGIEKLNSSDYVSVDPINDALDKLDKLGVDYVTEQGTSGEWWWRKWRSGRAECGIDNKNFGTVEVRTEWGALFCSANNLTFGAYPFAFSSKPFVTIAFNGAKGQDQSRQSYTACAASTSTSTSPTFRLIDPYAGTSEETQCGIYVRGNI